MENCNHEPRAQQIRADRQGLRFSAGCQAPACEGGYSTQWALGGPVIERGQIQIGPLSDGWSSEFVVDGVIHEVRGATPLIAAMRAFVILSFGDNVQHDKPN
jgi:hypothetical protein